MDFYDILICLLLEREHCVPYTWLVHSINRQILDIQITLIRSGKKQFRGVHLEIVLELKETNSRQNKLAVQLVHKQWKQMQDTR